MKLKFTFLLGVFFLFSNAYSQSCISTVHANSNPIKNTQQLNNSDLKYWICDGGVLTLTGNRNSVWLDRGGILSISGDSNNIYARVNSTVSVAGNYNFIDIDIKVIQNGNYTDNGANTTKKNCSPMSFDYSVSPTGGCDFAIGVEDVVVVKNANIYPSPANDKISVEFPEETGEAYNVQVFDLNGREVLISRIEQVSNKFDLDVSSLPNGLYTLSIKSGNVLVNKQFAVQR